MWKRVEAQEYHLARSSYKTLPEAANDISKTFVLVMVRETHIQSSLNVKICAFPQIDAFVPACRARSQNRFPVQVTFMELCRLSMDKRIDKRSCAEQSG